MHPQASAMEDGPLAHALHRKLLPLLADSKRPEHPEGRSYTVITLDVDDLIMVKGAVGMPESMASS